MERSRTVFKPEKILFRQKFSVHTLDHTTLMIGISALKNKKIFKNKTFCVHTLDHTTLMIGISALKIKNFLKKKSVHTCDHTTPANFLLR